MSRMFRSLDYFVLSCLFLPAISERGEISPPQNLTLRWIDDFKSNLSWIPQDSVRNCNYTVEILPETGEPGDTEVNTSSWSGFTIMGGRSLSFHVKTDCNGRRSKAAVYHISYAELVKNVDCHLYAREKTRCQWNATSHPTGLQFFYRLKNERDIDKSWSKSQECSSYIRNASGVRTGCELEATSDNVIYISFHGNVNNTPARNTFKIVLKDNVKPPALTWTVVKSKDYFNISWKAPDVLEPSDWEYKIRYSECDKPKRLIKDIYKETYLLTRDSDCQYSIAMQAVVKDGGEGETPWSADKYLDKDLDALVYVAFIIPCVVAVLAALMFVCCRRNKDKFFPPIITPVDFLTDIENNNKSNLYNLQAPAEEEQTCEITVLDPELIRLDC